MLFVGDRPSYNKALEPADTNTYVCPVCGAEKEVPEEFDLLQRMWFPTSFQDTECSCGCTMDRKEEAMRLEMAGSNRG